MTNANPEENPLYSRVEDIHALHWENLARRDPLEAGVAAGAAWDGTAFTLPALGAQIRVCPARRAIVYGDGSERPVGYQRGLVVLTYLGAAMDVPTRGEWQTFRELPGGDVFFRGPHSLATPQLERAFGADPARLKVAGEQLGGAPCAGGDAAVEIAALPKIPVRALLWGRTEEFGAAANLLTDARAHLHLALDSLWALTNILIHDLTKGD